MDSAGVLVFHALLRIIDLSDGLLHAGGHSLVEDAVMLARRADVCLPFGSAHMQFTLVVAYVRAVDPEQRQAMETIMCKYHFTIQETSGNQ